MLNKIDDSTVEGPRSNGSQTTRFPSRS